MELSLELIEQLKLEYDINKVEEIIQGYNVKRYESFRINLLKANPTDILKILDDHQIDYIESSIYHYAYLTTSANLIRNLDIYKDGLIYFQSLSSMLPPLYLNLKDNSDLLDMAAAPGSKTSFISMLNPKINITACEIDKIRFERLKYNMDKLGVKNVNYLNQDATKLDDYFRFDEILLDAPCSGSGTINIFDNTSKFSMKLVKNSAILQKKLLIKALTILKKNQEMIYSTCSILKEENEEVLSSVKKIINFEIIKLDTSKFINDELLPSNIDGVITIKPNEKYEGFFIAKLKKL